MDSFAEGRYVIMIHYVIISYLSSVVKTKNLNGLRKLYFKKDSLITELVKVIEHQHTTVWRENEGT